MARRSIAIACAAALAAAVTLAVPATSYPLAPAKPSAPRVDPVLAAERLALGRARAQARQAAGRSASLEKRAAAAKDDASRARAQAAVIAARIQVAEADIGAGEAQLALARRRLGLQQARLAERQLPVIRLTAALQSLARKPAVAVLAQPGSLTDMVHIRSVLKAVLPEIERRTADLRAELERMRALDREADRAVAALQAGRDRLTQQRAQLSRLEAERRLTSRRFARGAAIESDRAIALGEDARDITQLLGSLENAAGIRAALAELPGPIARPRDPTRAIASASAPPIVARAAGRPAYRLPVVGEIVRGLGEPTPSGVRSRGLTIEAQSGAQVVAPADGRVAFAGPYRGYGSILIIEHDGGWTSLVTNLVGISVAVGDTVLQGDPIGRAGPGSPRITVELRRAGKPIDIVALLG